MASAPAIFDMNVNAIDILLGVLVVLSVLNGFRRGLIRGVLDLASWVLSLLAALRFYQPVARWLGPRVDVWSEVWDQPVAFILCATVTAVAVHVIGYALLRNLPKDIHERRINQLFGAIPGLVSGVISAAIVAALLLAIPINEGLTERVRESTLANRLAVYTERLESKLVPVFRDAVSQTLNLLTIRPESNERVSLPFTVAKPRPRPDLEAEMLKLVNKERVAAGLKPLAPDPELTEVARQHSTDMFARGYFAHITPEGRDPFDRIRAANIRFVAAGENLALAPTLQIAHTGLMNSPGHRANILAKDFGRVGIGIMDGGIRGLMVTQNFRD
jgi:uncharacterized protein YkwD